MSVLLFCLSEVHQVRLQAEFSARGAARPLRLLGLENSWHAHAFKNVSTVHTGAARTATGLLEEMLILFDYASRLCILMKVRHRQKTWLMEQARKKYFNPLFKNADACWTGAHIIILHHSGCFPDREQQRTGGGFRTCLLSVANVCAICRHKHKYHACMWGETFRNICIICCFAPTVGSHASGIRCWPHSNCVFLTIPAACIFKRKWLKD